MKLLKSFYRTFCTVEETICNIGFMAMIAPDFRHHFPAAASGDYYSGVPVCSGYVLG
mgnify:CR=1 FL=1